MQRCTDRSPRENTLFLSATKSNIKLKINIAILILHCECIYFLFISFASLTGNEYLSILTIYLNKKHPANAFFIQVCGCCLNKLRHLFPFIDASFPTICVIVSCYILSFVSRLLITSHTPQVFIESLYYFSLNC